MRTAKHPFLWACLAGCLFMAAVVHSQPALLSIQKGNEGERSWALLTFNEKIQWMGVYQFDENVLSLYFWGDPGALSNTRISVTEDFSRGLEVLGVGGERSFFKVEVNSPNGMPLAIFKKNRHMLITWNNEGLSESDNLDYASDISATPGRLESVNPEIQRNRLITSLSFAGSYDWVGFLKSSGQDVTLLIRDADFAASRNQYAFEKSSLQQMRFSPLNDGIRGFRARLKFDVANSYSIVSKPHVILVQTVHSGDEGTAVAAEASGIQNSSEFTPVSSRSEGIPGITTVAGPSPAKAAIPVSRTVRNEAPEPKETVQKTESSPSEAPIQKRPDLPAPGKTMADGENSGIPWNDIVAFEFHDTPLKDALRLIAKTNRLNMVIADGVQGKVTVDLKNVTLRQAIDIVVATQNCDYLVSGDIITVKPVGVLYAGGRQTKVYYLKYADAENVAQVIRQVASNDSLVKVFYGEYLYATGETSAGANRAKANKVGVQGIRRSSTLVVTDRPEKIEEIDGVIARLDAPPKQIMIESKLVEMAPNKNKTVGINWDNTLTMALQWQKLLPTGDALDYSILDDAFGEGGEWKMGKLSASQFKAVIDFLDTKTNSELISNPQLLAMDNEESSISVGTTVPVPRIQRGLGGQGDMITFDYKEVNIQLNVTPHLSDNGEITMYVNPVIEEITGWVTYGEQTAPITDKRTVNSIVSVRSGETVVIGGLIKTQTVKTTKKVWFLGSIPLIGRLFQHEKNEDKKTNLIIFITPKLV